MFRLLTPLLVLFSLLTSRPLAAAGEPGAFVWIESETASVTGAAPAINDWGSAGRISGDALQIIASEDEATKMLKAGVALDYTFTVAAAGDYTVWHRTGFEGLRPALQWRVDEGEWHDVPSSKYTTDIRLIRMWNEIAWLDMGKTTLSPGKHTLQIRLVGGSGEAKGKGAKLMYVSDAFCLVQGDWRPEGTFKPGEGFSTDADRAAAEKVYALSPAAPGLRSEIELTGAWEYARFDETEVTNRTGPTPYATDPRWRAIDVPSDRNRQIADDTYAHRFLCRTRVQIPASLDGQRFELRFAETNTFTTVYVNGQRVHHTDIFATGWSCDITDAVKPGQVNEIVIGIKDAVYALNPPGERTCREFFHMEWDGFIHNNQGVTNNFEYAVRGVKRVGITDIVTLSATGRQRVEDVFVRTSVEPKTINSTIEISSPEATTATIAAFVVDPGGNEPVKTLSPKQVELKSGTTTMELTDAWPEAELWWPDSPKLYDLVTTVRVGDKLVDTQRVTFGFREWKIVGTRFTLNGQPWKLITDCTEGYASPDALVEDYRKMGASMYRLRFQSQDNLNYGLTQRQLLDAFDRLGLPVRRTASPLDGQVASYRPVISKGKEREANVVFFDNWRKQMLARVKYERNHPSIFVWETDNEFVFINLRNFGFLELCEPQVHQGAKMVMELDPTRGMMSGGGRAGLDQFFPIYGCHYEDKDANKGPDGLSHRDYPDEAYEYNKTMLSSQSQPWPMEWDRPIFHSEIYFADGYKPEDHAAIGGEKAFVGRAGTFYGADKYGRMLVEGARWRGVAANHFWMGKWTVGAGGKPVEQTMYNAWNDRAILCRQWNWSFGAAERVTRDLKVFNDTRYTDPITARWQLTVDGKTIAEDEKTFTVAPGQAEAWSIAFDLPQVSDADRVTGTFTLTSTVKGEVVFRDVKAVAVLNPASVAVPEVKPGRIAVWDKSGAASTRLKSRGIAFDTFEGVENVPADASVIVIGSDTLDARDSTDPRWLGLAESGRRIVVLDQVSPLHYQAVAADFETSRHVGRIAHIENASHPIMAGIQPIDLDTWGNDHVNYRNPLKKGSRGLIPLIQCDTSLGYTPLAESRIGDGTMIFCQLAMGQKLNTVAAASRIFDQAINYALDYRTPSRRTIVVADAGSPLKQLFESSSVLHESSDDLLGAIADGTDRIVVAEAKPERLRALAENRDRVAAFTRAGGYLMLSNVTPEGLSDFNTLVGVDHSMRPFFQEKTALPDTRDALIAGASLRDVALYSGKRIVNYQSVEWLADDAYTYIVDLDDPAAFGVPQGMRNVVNGMTSTDFWKYIQYFNFAESKPELTLSFPKPYTLDRFSIVPNLHYYNITHATLTFSDGTTQRIGPIEADEVRQDFDLTPVTTDSVTLTFEWPDKPYRSDKPTIGVDNLWLHADRGAEFGQKVVPLLNIGGLVKYPNGAGAIVLNQLNVTARETNPVNAEKKRAIYNILLANMGARFAQSKRLTPGAQLAYTPVSLESVCNAYIKRGQGWHDEQGDFSALPLGDVKFGGVAYDIRDFRTSPLESAVVLKNRFAQSREAPEAVRIDVNQKADALFFLHSYIPTREYAPRRARDGSTPDLTAFEYVIEYEGGGETVVPVVLGEAVGPWLVSGELRNLKRATIAWDAPATKQDQRTVVYQMQWDNPSAEKPIRRVTLRYNAEGKSTFGSPILFGVTAAKRPVR